jgi:ubiquinone/menaquinone biosynthesis C-methylase UbiE
MSDQYYHTEASVKEYISMAEGVSGAALIELLKTILAKNSSLLELGSGPGTDWEILKENYRVTGSDFSKQFLNHLKKKYPNEKFLHLDARYLKTELSFEGIYSNKVLHHLKDDELASSIKSQLGVLEDGGIICHSFWIGEGSEIFKGMYVNYQNKESLTKVFSSSFEIICLNTYKEFEDNDSILIIAKKRNKI